MFGLTEIAVNQLIKSFGGYTDLIAALVRLIAPIFGVKIDRLPWEKERQSVDARLIKLDEARNALIESLRAIDELQIEAENKKRDYDQASIMLNSILISKGDAERKLDEIQIFDKRKSKCNKRACWRSECIERAFRRIYHWNCNVFYRYCIVGIW